MKCVHLFLNETDCAAAKVRRTLLISFDLFKNQFFPSKHISITQIPKTQNPLTNTPDLAMKSRYINIGVVLCFAQALLAAPSPQMIGNYTVVPMRWAGPVIEGSPHVELVGTVDVSRVMISLHYRPVH